MSFLTKSIRQILNIHHRQAFAYHRYMANFLRIRPSFFIIGTQKAGTTSLFNYLLQHPEITSPLIKELQFFNMNYQRGINYYHSFFPINKPKLITGEATPDYLDHPNAPRRLFKYQPNAKLIVVLRNPIDRAFSHFNFVQSYDKQVRQLTFEQALDKEKTILTKVFDDIKNNTNEVESAINLSNYGYTYKGLYVKHIKLWREFFPENQILIVDFNDIKNDTTRVLKQICMFLNIDEQYPFDVSEIKNKTNYNSRITSKTKQLLTNYFKPYNEELFQYLNRKFDWLDN